VVIPIGIMFLGGSMILSGDTRPLRPEETPSDAQGVVGSLLFFGAPVIYEFAPTILGWLGIGEKAVEEACKDSDCTNEVRAITENLCADGDCGNEVKSISDSLSASMESVIDKLDRYLLNPRHPIGGHKAKWFKEALGYTRENMYELARQIVFDESVAIQTEVTAYGTKYNQVITIVGANGKEIDVLFAWIRNLDGVVRLVSGMPAK
jgi:hypothetical protein